MAGRGYRSRLYAEYFSSSGYDRSNPADDEGFRSHGRVLRQIILPHLPAKRDAAIVDVACGIGYTVEILQHEGYTNVRGLDLSPAQVSRATARGLPVAEADAFAFLGGVRDELDVILAFDFIEHLDRDELFAFLDAVRVALRPGGRLIVKTPNASCLFGSRSRYVDLTHEIVFTEKSLRAAFAASDLLPLVVAGERIRPFTLGGWVRWAPAKAVRLAWKAYLIAELAGEGFSIPTEFNLVGVAERPVES
jgi:2-polyprenyl-3-methyl-5-hydroxy-6-metoxy-1,4-benzoquinol methylase